MAAERRSGWMTRRACLRLVLLAAAGLSLVPGCGRRRSSVEKWARLGRVWRRFRSFEGGKVRLWRRPSFNRFKREMRGALNDLPAWPELRGVFEQRAGCIESCFRQKEAALMGITCYARSIVGPRRAARDATEQAEELMKLAASGSLTEEAARKAARALAMQAEYIVLAEEASEIADKSRRYQRERELDAQYREEEIGAGPPAQLAGERLAELTVDKLGWLAGPPKEGEGRPTQAAGQ